MRSSSLGGHLRETAILAWPVIAGQLGHIVIANGDTVMVGKLGSVELAAASLANSVFFLIAVIGIGVCVAISPLTAQALGAKRHEEDFSRLFHQGLIVSFWLTALSVLLILGISLVLPLLGQAPAVVELAVPYLAILAASLLPMMLFLAVKHFIDGFEVVIPGMLVMGLVAGSNLFFNWLLIYGNGGFPEMRLNGAGWATLLSKVLGFLLILGYFMVSRRFQAYFRLRSLFLHRRREIVEILKIGLPSGLQYFFEVGAFSGAVLLAGRIGAEAQSAHQIAIAIASVTYMFYMGISAAVSIRVGNALGRADFPAVRMAGLAAVVAGLICIVVFVTIIIGFKGILPGFYIAEEAVVKLSVGLLMIAAIFQVFDGIQAIVMGALRGILDVNIPTLIAFVAYWIIGLPCAWFFSEGLGIGVEGIWYGLTAGLAFSALALSIRFIRKSSHRHLVAKAASIAE